jgi:hypothetical protein
MHGSGSTEINVMEGDAIPEVTMDNNVSAELRIGSDGHQTTKADL